MRALYREGGLLYRRGKVVKANVMERISCNREHNSFRFSHKAFETKQNLQ